ncbi:hypothetical protein [Synechococcus sp. TAK9802]|uniref:hypothetical protein n=1 Tax=Synechococcus sp. TAK9802 TaxID=1442558 RepID=UPI001645DF80|nr:hypothetical protein [Synechococcus sp. TAK9802]QNI60878.1 polysaccharide biosynthesis family protein [Synechococcus sp. TAK9802]
MLKRIFLNRGATAYSLQEALLLLPAVVATVKGFLFVVRQGSGSWMATDWYISNEFGFVRRGLLGGLLRQASEQLGGLDINIFAFSITLLSLLIVSTVAVFNSRNLPYINRFAIAFSPAFYPLFILLDPNAGGRKEALSMLLIVSYALSQRLQGRYKKLVGTFLIVVGLPAITLIHESNLLFSAPVLFFIILINYISDNSRDSLRWFGRTFGAAVVRALVLLVPGLAAFFFAYLHSTPDPYIVKSICTSWQPIVRDLSCNPLPAALGALASQDGYLESIKIAFSRPRIYAQILYSVFYVFLLVNAFCCPIVPSSASTDRGIERAKVGLCVQFLGVIIFLPSIPLYALAIDYGRWYSTTVTILIVTCVVCRERIASVAILLPESLFKRRLNMLPVLDAKVASLLLIFGSSICTVPHCCAKLWQFTSIARQAAIVISGS